MNGVNWGRLFADYRTYVVLYLLVVNIYGYVIIFVDKSKSRKGQWRIPEKRLFTAAAIGGSLGVYWGMKSFRHKTKHKSFTIGIPAIIIGQLLILLYITGLLTKFLSFFEKI